MIQGFMIFVRRWDRASRSWSYVEGPDSGSRLSALGCWNLGVVGPPWIMDVAPVCNQIYHLPQAWGGNIWLLYTMEVDGLESESPDSTPGMTRMWHTTWSTGRSSIFHLLPCWLSSIRLTLTSLGAPFQQWPWPIRVFLLIFLVGWLLPTNLPCIFLVPTFPHASGYLG